MSSDINTSSIIAHIKSGDIRKKLLDKVELESVSERRSHNKASDVIPAARVSQLNHTDDEKYDSEHNNKKKKKKKKPREGEFFHMLCKHPRAAQILTLFSELL